MEKVTKAKASRRRVLVKSRPQARLSEQDVKLINELVGSLRARGLQPMDVYRAIAERLRQRSLSR